MGQKDKDNELDSWFCSIRGPTVVKYTFHVLCNIGALLLVFPSIVNEDASVQDTPVHAAFPSLEMGRECCY